MILAGSNGRVHFVSNRREHFFADPDLVAEVEDFARFQGSLMAASEPELDVFNSEMSFRPTPPRTDRERYELNALGLPPSEPRLPFFNAQRAALVNPQLRYVEGVVAYPGVVPATHAWVEDDHGVIELTLSADGEPLQGSIYLGAAIPTSFVRQVWLKDKVSRPMLRDHLRVQAESYFNECPRDEFGRCLPSGEAEQRVEQPGAGQTQRQPNGKGSQPAEKAPTSQRMVALDPWADGNGDGVTDAARVGVPGMEIPETIPRLLNLTPDEQSVQDRFIAAYEAPGGADKLARRFLDQVRASDKPNTFETDQAKMLSPDYRMSPDHQAIYNLALHQTANAIAKRAFLMHLDEIGEGGSVLVTAGGVAAGKGFAIKGVGGAAKLAGEADAVWDTAGEQNSTELPWVLAEAEKRKLDTTFVYVDNDPLTNYGPGVIGRAIDEKTGKAKTRTVAIPPYADSYVVGAWNFDKFMKANGDRATFIVIRNRRGEKPQQLNGIPPEALKLTRAQIENAARGWVEQNKATMPDSVYMGTVSGERILKIRNPVL